MEPSRTFVSSCAISLGSRNSAKKPQTATSISLANTSKIPSQDVKGCVQEQNAGNLTSSSSLQKDKSGMDTAARSPESLNAASHIDPANKAEIFQDMHMQCHESASRFSSKDDTFHHVGASIEERHETKKQQSMEYCEEFASNLSVERNFNERQDFLLNQTCEGLQSTSKAKQWYQFSAVNESFALHNVNHQELSSCEILKETEGAEHFQVCQKERNLETNANEAQTSGNQDHNTTEKPQPLCTPRVEFRGSQDHSELADSASQCCRTLVSEESYLSSMTDAFSEMTGFAHSAMESGKFEGGQNHFCNSTSSSNQICSGHLSNSSFEPAKHLSSGNPSVEEQSCSSIPTETDRTDSPVISIFKGNVRLKSKAFELNKSMTMERKNCSDLSADLNGIVNESVNALQCHQSEGRHESQLVGEDADEVDGHVRMKQTLFETLPVDALYEHGSTHSSQIVTRGRRKSNLGSVLNDFNTKPLGEINEKDRNSPDKDVIDFDVSGAVSSFKKTMQTCDGVVNKDTLHESQRVDYDIPFNNSLVKENSERFLHEDFCYKREYQSSQTLTEEERVAASGLLTSIRGEFESKPLDFIGVNDRSERHPSQLIEDEHMSKTVEQEDFALSERHSSQQINYHEEVYNGVTQVREKRRQYYDSCNSPARCQSRELIEDFDILHSPDIAGIVKQNASVYLESQLNERHHKHRGLNIPGSDVYVGPLKDKFESQSLSQLGRSDELHPSQCIEPPTGLSEEALHHAESPENLSLHTSQVIDPTEYVTIRSDVGSKKKAFTKKTTANRSLEHQAIVLDSDVKAIKHAFESCQTPPPSGLHPSQIVGHDIHLISSSEAAESLSRSENSLLHESQRVNYGIVRPQSRHLNQITSEESTSKASERPSHSKSRTQSRSSIVKSPEADDKDLELLLNYTPVIKQELPSMVTVMVKGVPDDLIKSGHPMVTEYVTDSKSGKRVLVGSGRSTPQRNTSGSSRSGEPRNERINDFVQPLDSLPAFPDSGTPESGCDVTEQPLPPPPPMFGNGNSELHVDGGGMGCNFVQDAHPNFVIGSSIRHPSNYSNAVFTHEAEYAFMSSDQERVPREKNFARLSRRQMTSSAESFLRVHDEELNRRISAATVESYPESDDTWDFVG